MEKVILSQADDIQSDNIRSIIKQITSLIAVDRIYHIGHSMKSVEHDGMFKSGNNNKVSRHFDFLVIIEGPCNADAFNVQSIINQNKDIVETVSLWMHSTKNVQEALLGNDRFFHTLFRSDTLIYQKADTLESITLPDYDDSKDSFQIELSWFHRYNRADALIVAAANIIEYEEDVVETLLLAHAMEQICIGFIFVSIGYKPNQRSLKHLFSICRCINPVIDEVFPTALEDDKGIFNTLVRATKDMRYRTLDSIHPTDLGMLQRRCRAWMEKAEELVKVIINDKVL